MPQRKINVILIFSLLIIAGSALAQDKVQQKIPDKTRILFVLDGSGSMEAQWTGGSSRMTVAKRILTRLVDSLRVNANVELALRVYGHQFARTSNNCQDSKLEVPFRTKNHDAIIEKIGGIRPKGTTPITYSLSQAANDFPGDAGYRNILILITDGIESCGGDPCEVSVALQRKGIFLKPFVIGLGLEGAKNLDCVGKYLDAENSRTFNKALNETIETTFSRTSVSIELLNADNKPLETNVNVSFINNATGMAAYEFVHYLDANGKPDSVQIDPVLGYDLIVNTVPPIIRRNVNLKNGTHNVISIPAPQGNLTLRQERGALPFSAVVTQKGKSPILNEQRSGETFRYLAGEYEVVTLTLPRRIFNVSIKPDQTQTISLPPTGLVNINTITQGYGSLFEVMENGETRWVCNLDENKSRHAYNLLPGKYKIVFRAKRAGGSKYTGIKEFDISSGQTVNMSVFN